MGSRARHRLIALALGALLACGKYTTIEDTKTPTEPSACDVEVESLRTWLRDVTTDGDVPYESVVSREDPNRFIGRPLPIVPLLRREEPPRPLMHVAMVTLHRGQAHFGDDSASVGNAAAFGSVMKKVGASALSPGFGFGRQGSFTEVRPVVVFVGERERWGDVAALFEGLSRAGFAQIELPFEVKPTANAPADSVAFQRMKTIASDPKEMPWKIDVALAKELKERERACPAVATPFLADAHDSTAMDIQRQQFMKEAPTAVRACACKADLDAIRAFAWVRFGRHWGPTTASYSLELPGGSGLPANAGADAGVTTIAAPADTPWRDMAERLVQASRNKTPLRFAVR